MPFVTGIITALGVVGSFFSGLGAFGSFMLNAAVGVGLSLASRALAGKPASQEVGARVGGVQGKLQAAGDLSRSFPLGYSVTAGSLVYANYWGNDGDTPNAYFTQVIAASDLSTALAGVYVSSVLVTLLTGEAHPDYGVPVQEYRKDGKDHLWIKYHDGTQTTADTFLSNYVASTDRPWGPDRIGAGIAYVVCTALAEDTLFNGFPQFRFALDGVKLYDPSRDDTAGGSGAQRWSDPSTWGGDGDDFPAVQAYNVLRGISFGGVWLYGLQGVSSAQLPNVAWINAIAACRNPVEIAGGAFEPSYRAGMELQVSHTIGDTLDVLMTACQGRLSEIGGSYKMNAGPPGAPVVTFTDGDILSTEEQTFTPFFGLAETVNGITGSYPEPAEGWNMKVAPPLLRTDLEARDGGRRLTSDVKFDAVPYPEQVQRLMKSALLEAQRARRHTYSMPPEFWLLEPGDIVGWDSARNGYIDKLFRVDGVVDKANADVILDLTEVDPSDYDWDHDSDFRPVPPVPIVFVRPAPQAVLDWYAEGQIVYDANGFARRPAILLEWNGSVTSDIAAVQFEVREDFGDMNVVHANRMDNVAAGATLISQNLLPNADYQVRGRYIPANPRDTLWSDWIAVTTPNVLIGERDIISSLLYQMTELQDQIADNNDAVNDRLNKIANQHASNWVDKKDVRRQFNSRTDAAFAEISEVMTVATNTQEAFAAYQITVSAEFDDVNASVAINADAIATLDGYAASRYGVTLDVNGYASGFQLVNGGGGISSFTVLSASFQVAFPGQPGGAAAPVFTLGSVNGSTKLALRGDMLIDGTILARHIATGSVTADKIEAGSINTSKLAVNSVDINNIVANAATKVNSYDGGSVTLSVAGTVYSLVTSGVVNFPVACNVVIIGSTMGNGGSPTTPIPSVGYPSEASSITFGIYVDGALVSGSQRTFVFSLAFGGGIFFPAPGYFDLVVIGETTITAGNHTIEIRASYVRYPQGSTDPSSPVVATSTKMVVTQNRR